MKGFMLFVSVCLGTMSCSNAHRTQFHNPLDHGSHEARLPVDPVCQRLGEEGSCTFYKCYENRHPCGERGYAMMYGFGHCNQFLQHYNSFTDEGPLWINNTYRCLTQSMLPLYERDTVSCAEISDKIDHAPICLPDTNFCSIFLENRWSFSEVALSNIGGFLGRNALQNWRELLQLFRRCLLLRL